MPDYVFRANIAHFKEVLARETDLKRIELVKRLLAEEEAKLADWLAKNKGPKAVEVKPHHLSWRRTVLLAATIGHSFI